MKNLEEFLAKTKPGAKKSRLHEFLPAIKSLRDKGYTLNQIQNYLLENDVDVSVAWLSAFLRTHQISDSKPSQLTRAGLAVTQAVGKNPFSVLSGEPKDGDYSPIPKAKFEVDNS